MSTAAIIAEYNPFHTGHAWQIEQTRKLTNAEHILVIMSGDFVQRGAPAIMDKYTRTRLALEGGADFVLELPVRTATASAADFALGAVSILNALNCVDYLCFGSESTQYYHLLEYAAWLFLTEPLDYKMHLKEQLALGKSFPKAREAAWEKLTGISGYFLEMPNNILGISYLMALKQSNSKIQPITVERECSYHSTKLGDNYASASALRKRLYENYQKQLSFPEEILPYLGTEAASGLLTQLYGNTYPMETADFWPILKAKLLSEAETDMLYAYFPDELANRLKKCHFTCTSYEELASSLKTAAYTRSRIDRGLLHLLLSIRQEKAEYWKQSDSALYARLLGFRKSHSDFLRTLIQKSRIPILTRALPPKEFSCTEAAASSYALDVYASNLYEAVKGIKFSSAGAKENQTASEFSKKNQTASEFSSDEKKPVHEYRQKLIIL